MITLLLNVQRNKSVEKNDVNKVLRISGFEPDQVAGITINDYRSNQVEVLFKENVKFDTLEIEEKIRSNGLDVIVSKFDLVEEYLMIYGLPLSSDMDSVKVKIEESIKPFVKQIVELKPCVHKDEHGQDFFKGHLNGNWFVKVIPKKEAQIPNYVVVGNQAQVMAKAVYTKKVGEKLEMCSDCFSTTHLMRSQECPGPVKWSVYCKSFRDYWDANTLGDGSEVTVDSVGSSEEESRLVTLNRTLMKSLEETEKQRDSCEEKISQQDDLKKKVDELTETVRINEVKIKSSGEANDVLRSDLEISQKRTEELENKIAGLMDNSIRRMSLSSNVNFETTEDGDENVEDDLEEQEEGEVEEVGEVGEKGDKEEDLVVDVAKETDPMVNGSDPPFHGFTDHSSENQNSQNLAAAVIEFALPKKRPGESPGEHGRGKRMKGGHPEIGSKIRVETLKGFQEYIVSSKKSIKKLSDCNYYLENDENKTVAFDLKEVYWDYVNGEVFDDSEV